MRSIESCFETNPRAGKAAVFAGWREMDQYMRENKIEGQPTPSPEGQEAAVEKKPAPAAKPAAAGQKSS